MATEALTGRAHGDEHDDHDREYNRCEPFEGEEQYVGRKIGERFVHVGTILIDHKDAKHSIHNPVEAEEEGADHLSTGRLFVFVHDFVVAEGDEALAGQRQTLDEASEPSGFAPRIYLLLLTLGFNLLLLLIITFIFFHDRFQVAKCYCLASSALAFRALRLLKSFLQHLSIDLSFTILNGMIGRCQVIGRLHVLDLDLERIDLVDLRFHRHSILPFLNFN